MVDGRSMRAVKNNLPTPSGEVEESKGPRQICVRRNGSGPVENVQCPCFLAFGTSLGLAVYLLGELTVRHRTF